MESSFPASAPQRRLVTPATALYSPEFLGLPAPLKPNQAARLLLARGRYPLPTVLVMGRRMVRVDEIHHYIDSLQPSNEPQPQAPRRRRGRPSNAEIARSGVAAIMLAGEDQPPRRKPGRPSDAEIVRSGVAAIMLEGEDQPPRRKPGRPSKAEVERRRIAAIVMEMAEAGGEVGHE